MQIKDTKPTWLVDCPYDFGTKESDIFMEGFHKGRAMRRDEILEEINKFCVDNILESEQFDCKDEMRDYIDGLDIAICRLINKIKEL